MPTANLTYNNYGASVEKFLSLFPGVSLDSARVCDLGSEQSLIEALGRAAREVTSKLRKEFLKQISDPELVKVVGEGQAVSGQTSFTLGLVPLIAGSLHVWIRPLDSFYYGTTYYYQYCDDKPRIGYGELSTSDFSVDVNTGVVTLLNGVTLHACDVVYVSYKTDTENTAFEIPSMADWCYTVAAPFVIARSYQQDAESNMLKIWVAKADQLLKDLDANRLLPQEIKALNYYYEIDNDKPVIRSARTRRV